MNNDTVFSPFSRPLPHHRTHCPICYHSCVIFFSVGKTSLLSVFVENQFTDAYKATIGADYYCKNIQLDDNCPIQCQLWGELARSMQGVI